MAEEGCYITFLDRLCAHPDDCTSKSKVSPRPRQFNISLKRRKVVLLKTSDETPSRNKNRAPPDMFSALRLCDDGLAETVEDSISPEVFKSFDFPRHLYLQRFEFFKALWGMGLRGKSYKGLRDQLVKKFKAFSDTLRESHGASCSCCFTAYLYVVKVDLVYSMDSVSYHRRSNRDGGVEKDDMSSIASPQNSCNGFNPFDEECNSSWFKIEGYML